jgi:hypothetical protein
MARLAPVLRWPFKAFCLNLPEKQLHEGAPLPAFILLKNSREASNQHQQAFPARFSQPTKCIGEIFL